MSKSDPINVKHLSPAKVRNLAQLATYLENLSEDYEQFDMDLFTSLLYSQETIYARENGGIAKYDCGAVACAVGHAPAAGILVPPRFIHGNAVAWDDFSHYYFCPRGIMWDWFFDDRWSASDNRHRGAAARIRFVLAGNDVPHRRDSWGDPIISYSNTEVYNSYYISGDKHIQG